MNTFSPLNESAVSKLRARETRICLSADFIHKTKPRELEVFSLPGYLGRYEKHMISFLRSRKVSFNWNAFESEFSRWNRAFNPFGTGRMKEESEGVRTIRLNSGGVASYAHKEIEILPGDVSCPILLDADFCGYLSDEILEKCVDNLTRGSLAMFTFFTRWRGWKSGGNMAEDVADAIESRTSENLPVSVQHMESAYIRAIENRLHKRKLSFSRVAHHPYMNTGNREDSHGSPMVLLAWHLVEKSPLGEKNFA